MDDRFPVLREDGLDDRQRRMWQGLVRGRGGTDAVGEQGGLIGPMNVLLRAPELGRLVAALGEELKFGGSMPPRTREIAIVTVAARWRAEYEWWYHARAAAAAGVEVDVLDAIANREAPRFRDEADEIVHHIALELLDRGELADPTFERARLTLGEELLVSVVVLVGYYCIVSFALNAGRVPLPPGAAPRWPPDE